jgi:hypothetical protein
MTNHEEFTAAAAGTWTLGDLTVNRMGFGAQLTAGEVARLTSLRNPRVRRTSTES